MLCKLFVYSKNKSEATAELQRKFITEEDLTLQMGWYSIIAKYHT